MQTPQEYNEWFMQQFSMKRGLNIKCPKCIIDVEMKEQSPGMQLLSYPAQIAIYCPECNYSTTIYTN
jgi:endogenous inhibitor of DNA gyrase (YacG/DUF329 family)